MSTEFVTVDSVCVAEFRDCMSIDGNDFCVVSRLTEFNVSGTLVRVILLSMTISVSSSNGPVILTN